MSDDELTFEDVQNVKSRLQDMFSCEAEVALHKPGKNVTFKVGPEIMELNVTFDGSMWEVWISETIVPCRHEADSLHGALQKLKPSIKSRLIKLTGQAHQLSQYLESIEGDDE